MTNHWVMEHGEPVRARLREVQAPTLVLHGTDDPLFPTRTPKPSLPRSHGHGCSHYPESATSTRRGLPGMRSSRRSSGSLLLVALDEFGSRDGQLRGERRRGRLAPPGRPRALSRPEPRKPLKFVFSSEINDAPSGELLRASG
jgi:hypothetical protein